MLRCERLWALQERTRYLKIQRTKKIFDRLKKLGADQVTFRKLYSTCKGTEQDKWIEEYNVGESFLKELKEFIVKNGKPLRKLEYGQTLYSLRGMSTVLDDDCMSKELKKEFKYVILRPNCKLYSQWDDIGSLIF
jgi:hypothetical protein